MENCIEPLLVGGYVPFSPSQNFVDHWTHKTGKMRPHVKYSLKGEIFLDFMLTFAMSLMIFACLDLQH